MGRNVRQKVGPRALCFESKQNFVQALVVNIPARIFKVMLSI